MFNSNLKLNRVLVLLALVLIGLNLRPSMASIGPILNSIRADISLTFTMVSLLTMLPIFTMGVAMFIGIRLSNRLGEFRLISYSLILIACATFYRFYTKNSDQLLVTAIIAGLGIALIQSVIPKIIKNRFPQSIELYMGVYVTSIMGGAALSASVSPFIGEYSSNWRLALSVWAGLAILALFSWFIVRKRIGSTKLLDQRRTSQTYSFYKKPRRR